MNKGERVLLINPQELTALCLYVAPEATHFFCIGEPARSWEELTAFLLRAFHEAQQAHHTDHHLHQSPSDGSPLPLPLSDTFAIRNVDAGPEKLHIQLEWCGRARHITYFFQDVVAAEWPLEIDNINMVVDIGPSTPPLSAHLHQLGPRLSPTAVLLATAGDYDERWFPHFPRVEKPAPPQPDTVTELWGVTVYRFQALRALLQPHQYKVPDEVVT